MLSIKLKSRNNAQIWRLAKYIYDEVPNAANCEWEEVDIKNRFYDFAVELIKKLENRDFTGPDLHKD